MIKKENSGTVSRRNTKKIAVEMLGGSCSICGYKKCQAALDFHHQKMSDKLFQISKYKRKEILNDEILKCQLLCKNCHAEFHYTNQESRIKKSGKVIRVCKKHGETLFYVFNSQTIGKKYACVHCMLHRQKISRLKLKKELISLSGGACQSCGYTNIVGLEFHHLDEKTWQISTIKNREIAIQEIKKCRLLCRNCHMEEHWTTVK